MSLNMKEKRSITLKSIISTQMAKSGPNGKTIITILLFLFSLIVSQNLYACSAPTADFSVDNTTPVVGQPVSFTDNSSNSPSSWSWNFGAGASPGTSTAQNPANISYTTTGLKTVSLKASNIWGSNTKTKTDYINVSATPVPTAGSNSPICAGTALSLTASTISGATYSWTGPNGFTSTSQNPTVSSSATTAMAGTYSVTVTLYGFTSIAGTTTVTVNSPPTAPTGISGTTSICSGSTTTLTATGGTEGSGCTYQWGTGTTVGSNIISGATSASYTTSALSANTTYWVRRVGASPCSNTTSGVTQLITVNALPTASSGIAASPASLCQGSSSTISVTNPGTGYTTDWYTGSCGGSAVSGGTGVNSLSVNPDATTIYYARKRNTSTGCVSASCANVTVTVIPASVGGTATAAASSVCSGSSTAITVTGYTGTIQWQQSANGTSGWANVTGGSGATSATYTTPNLTATTYYRAVVTSGACSSANSSTASVTVNPVSVGGTATATSSVICAGNNTNITVTGYTGSIQWQQSSNGTSGWTNVTGGSGATSATYTTPALSANTYYRAMVTSGACSSANSTTAMVTVNAASVGGIASASVNALCSGNGTTINLSGHTGNTIQWQQSPDGISNWVNVGTGSTYATGNLSSNSFYRAMVTNGVCASANSTTTGVFINPGYTWNGTDNNWGTSSNWKFTGITGYSPNVSPLSCSDVTIPKLSTDKYPTLSGNTTIHNLTIEDGASLIGNQYLTVNGTAIMKKVINDSWYWHLLSSPVSKQYIWNQFAPAPSGSSYLNWTWPSSGINWDFFYFNPNVTNVYPNVPWVSLRKAEVSGTFPYNYGPVDATTPNNTGGDAGFGQGQPYFAPGRGYLIAYNNASFPIEHDFMATGTEKLNDGDYSVTLSTTGSLYHLLGNPYPSSIDWGSSNWGSNRNGLETSGTGFDYWIFNDAGSGNYLVGNSGGTYTSGLSQYIAPMQGFFVKSNSSGGVFKMTNSVRAHSSQKWIKSVTDPYNILRLQIATNQNNYWDEMIVDFNPLYSGEEGSSKLASWYAEAPEIWSVKNSNSYTIDRYKSVTSGLTINVSVKCGVSGTYTIKALDINDFGLSNIVYLYDLKTGNKVDLKQTGSYTFSGGPNDNKERFRISFAEITGKEEVVTASKMMIFSYGKDVYINTGNQNPGECEVYVYDELGRQIEYGQCKPVSGIYKYTTLSKSGVYIIKVVTGSGITTTKVIIQ